MTTLHANSVHDAVHRLELLGGFAGFTGSEVTFRGQIASALQMVIHVARLTGGERRVISIAEVLGLERNNLKFRELFRYDEGTGQHLDLRELK
jgi:pilus assembly protein CpaF